MTVSHGEHAQAFLAAMRDAHKAWAGTPMLARVLDSQAQHVCSTLARADAPAVAEMLSEMAGPSIASYAVRTNLDGDKVMQLSALVAQMIAPACVAQREQCLPEASLSERAIVVCVALRMRLLCWIDTGECGDVPPLAQVNELIGRSAAIRLCLVAATAPVLVHCEIVARAISQGYPFSRGLG